MSLKSAFFTSIAVSLISGVIIQIALINSRGGSTFYTLLNLRMFLVEIPALLAIILGVILLIRWIRSRRFFDKEGQHRASGGVQSVSINQKPDQSLSLTTEKWNALVRFDADIRAAAEKLRPFGDQWVTELSRAYFALNEDRKYLRSIVDRLLMEAEQDKARYWTRRFKRTFENETFTEESLSIIRAAELQGYSVSVEDSGTIIMKKKTHVSYLRSNYDIQRFGKWSLV
jgi:hypothetical protein